MPITIEIPDLYENGPGWAEKLRAALAAIEDALNALEADTGAPAGGGGNVYAAHWDTPGEFPPRPTTDLTATTLWVGPQPEPGRAADGGPMGPLDLFIEKVLVVP